MNPSFLRRSVMVAAIGLISALLAVPASADDLDEDDVAAQLCGAGAEPYDVGTAEYADRAEVALYVYGLNSDEDGTPAQLCSFAIVSTDDEDATLDGTWSLSVDSTVSQGAFSGSTIAVGPVTIPAGGNPTAVFSASGQQQTIDVKKASASKKKVAKKKYALAKKKAKKAYAKAGKTKKAKKAMAKKITKAKRTYVAAVTTTRTVTKRPYSLQLQFAIDGE